MSQRKKMAVIFGGTGFVGRQIVRELADRGLTVKIATRYPESAYFLRPLGNVGQIVPVPCDYSDADHIAEVVRGCDYVVNCIGILYEKGKRSSFQKAHVDIPAYISQACADEGVAAFVHISALACDKGSSRYAKSKYDGEKAIFERFDAATILRPSIVFGEDDSFFNMFAEMSRYLPFLPLIGGGKTKFQPVFVGDVADAALRALIDTEGQYKGKVYQLGGPDVQTFKELFETMFKHTKRPRRLVRLPFGVAKFETMFLPKTVLTADQVESLKTDNIVDEDALTFKHFDIRPTSMDVVLPDYLTRYQPGGERFGGKHNVSGRVT